MLLCSPHSRGAPKLLFLLSQALALYSALILIRVLISWVRPDPRNPIVRFLDNITEPVLAPLRALIPSKIFGNLDLSPLLAILLLNLVRSLLLSAA